MEDKERAARVAEAIAELDALEELWDARLCLDVKTIARDALKKEFEDLMFELGLNQNNIVIEPVDSFTLEAIIQIRDYLSGVFEFRLIELKRMIWFTDWEKDVARAIEGGS